MKRILSLILTFAIMFSLFGSVAPIGEKVYARFGQDVNGNPVENTRIYQPTDHPIYYYQPPVDENGNHDYFGYTMYDDPQDITDEEFFGIWDEIADKWISIPYLRYSEFPGLIKVAEAAKIGDYKTAKKELLTYYQEIRNTRDETEVYYAVPVAATPRLDAMSRNIFSYSMSTSKPIGGFDVPENEFGEVTLSVDSDVIGSFAGSFDEFSVEIASGDKYWTTAEIYTKDAKDEALRPYVSAIVNGIYTEFPVIKDAMIIAGNCGDVNYGYDEVAYVQEHGTYDNVDGSMGSYDQNTMRYFVAFDVGTLKATDSINNMEIHFTARNVISEDTKMMFSDDNGNPYEGEADRPKYMWATWYKDSAWQEDTITWNASSIMDKKYFSCNDMEAWDFISSSDTTLKGTVCGYHRDSDLSTLRYAWMGSRDERFAYTYIRQEMALINSIGCEPGVMNSLDMSTHMSGISSSFYAFLDSKYFTPDVCTAWLKFMWQLCDYQVENIYGKLNNNWGTYASGAVYDGVAKFPEFFTHDYWYERTLEDNNRMLGGFTLDDGLCIEQSHNYISTILTTMSTPLTTMIRTGHEGPYDEELYKVIYDCVKSLIYTSGPYFGGFNQADGYDPFRSYSSTFKTWYQTLFPDDENLAWLISNGTSGSMPENPTTVYPTSYKTFMRSSWDRDSLQLAFINVSDSRSSHFHNDQLSFAMFAYGSYLLVDPGYGVDQTGDGGRVWLYNKSPVQHNVVTINDTYDYIYDGVCAETTVIADGSGSRDFETNKYYDYQEYYNTGFSSSPFMQRSITFLKEQKFWIVSDYNVPNDPNVENVFAQHWHTYPDANMEYDDNLVVRTNYDGPNVTIVPIENEELDGVEWVDCYYSEEPGMKVIAQKAMYTKTQTGTGRFTTLIIPEDMDENFKISSTPVKNKSGLDNNLVNGAYFRITDKNTGDENYYFYYHINDDTLKPENGVIIRDYVTDATTLVVQQNSAMEVISVFMVNGSYVKFKDSEDKYLVKTEEPTTMSFKKSGKFVNILSSMYDGAEDVKGLQIYLPEAKAARLDGKDLSADIEDGLFVFDGTYGSNEITSGGGSSSGGSSSGGGGGGATVKPPIKEDVTESDDKSDDENQSIDSPVSTVTIPTNIAKELEGHWGEEEISSLYRIGIVTGDANGLRLKDNISRAEFVTLMVRAMDLDMSEYVDSFIDVDCEDWYADYIATAYNEGLVTGADGMFRPNDTITREEMCKIIACAINVDYELKQPDFIDADSISDWAVEYVNKAYSLNIINGMDDGTFAPKNSTLREQAFVVLDRFIKVLNK